MLPRLTEATYPAKPVSHYRRPSIATHMRVASTAPNITVTPASTYERSKASSRQS